MTAPAGDGPRTDTAERLAEALTLALQQWPHCPVPDGLYEEEVQAIVGVLLPVVASLAREQAAEELDRSAEQVRAVQGTGRPYDVADAAERRIRARAAALRGER